MKNIKRLLDVAEAQRKKGNHIAIGLMSDPGLSKTSQVKQWTEETPAPESNERGHRKYFEFITSQRMPSEISGMAMPNNDTKMMDIYDYEYLLQMQDGDVLAFDEFTNGNIMTLNACLTLIQERHMLSGKDLPSVIVVAMGNPQGQCDLLPQTKQRFLWYDVLYDAECWAAYIKKEYGLIVDKELNRYIEDQYRNGFKSGGTAYEFNYNTPRSMENLLRIATEVEKDDPFWEMLRMDRALRDSLYKTIGSVNQLDAVLKACNSWIGLQANIRHTSENQKDLKDLNSRLRMSSSWKDLAELLDEINNKGAYGNIGEMFNKFLEESDDQAVLNPTFNY